MNKNELLAELKRNGYTYATIAKQLGLSQNGFWRKVNKYHDFTLSEIQALIQCLHLDDQKVKDIFFN